MPENGSRDVVYEVLEGDAFALIRNVEDGFVPLTLRDAQDQRFLPLFRAADLAHAHLEQLPAGEQSSFTCLPLPANDLRAKEEILRAAAAQGVTQLEVDVDLSLQAKAGFSLAKAIDYVTSFQRATACL